MRVITRHQCGLRKKTVAVYNVLRPFTFAPAQTLLALVPYGMLSVLPSFGDVVMSIRSLACGLAALSVGLSLPANTLAQRGPRMVKAFEELHEEAKETTADDAADKDKKQDKLATATFGNGCFWCTEAVFEELHGVSKVISGYSGGKVPNPTYLQVSSKLTGHAEVIQLKYDPELISYAKLLEVFWRTHDPTTPNRQGYDVGPQYRSAIFYHNDEQRELAEKFKRKLNQAHAFGKPIVTEITKFTAFYPAEKYHQNYYALNSRAGYCQRIIRPKMSKFRKVFKDELKKNNKPSKKKPTTEETPSTS